MRSCRTFCLATPILVCSSGVVLDVPTQLDHLPRTDAAVRLRCEACGREDVRDREELIQRLGRGKAVALADVATWCGASRCDGQAVFADAVPCSDDPAEARRRAATLTLIHLACEVLHHASYERAPKPEQHAPARLALRVVHASGADTELCTAFWAKVTAAQPAPWDGCHNECEWMVQALVRRGWSVNSEFR